MASVIRGSGTSSLGGDLDIEGVLTYEDVASVDSVGVITARAGLHVTGGRVSIGDFTDPQSPLHIKGEITNQLPVSGISTGSLVISNADTAYGMNFGVIPSTGNGWIQQTRVDGTASNYGLLLNPLGGDVGIGTNNPARLLHLAGEGGANEVELRLDAMDGGERQITFTGSGSNTHIIRSTGTTDNSLVFIQGSNERLRITSGGDLGLGVSDNMNQAGTLYIVGGQGVRWSHPTDGTLYGDHYVSASGDHVFRSGSSLSEKVRITSGGALGLRSVASTTGGAPNAPHIVYHSVIDTACASGGTENLKAMANEEVSFIKIYYSWPSGSPQWKTGAISRNQGTNLSTTWFHESNSGHVFTLAISGDTLTITQSVGVTMNMVVQFETVDTTGLD